MSRGPGVARAVAGCLVLAATAALAATTAADDRSTTGATAPVPPRSADTAAFEAFVREVGIDMAAVPIEVRREWASAPRLIIDDCSIPGTHAGHGHGADRGEPAARTPVAVEHRPDR